MAILLHPYRLFVRLSCNITCQCKPPRLNATRFQNRRCSQVTGIDQPRYFRSSHWKRLCRNSSELPGCSMIHVFCFRCAKSTNNSDLQKDTFLWVEFALTPCRFSKFWNWGGCIYIYIYVHRVLPSLSNIWINSAI